jgi:hypothetical protein
MNGTHSELRARNLRTLAVLAGLFLLPLATAFWMYYGTGWRPARGVNHGELIAPARPLPATHLQPAVPQAMAPPELFHRKWSLVYIGNGRCEATCRRSLHLMRQTRLALNTDMQRVERVFLASADCCARELLAHEYPGLVVLDATGDSARSLLAVFPASEREQSLFIVDPLGNLMMRYDIRQNPRGLLEDLKKLLSLSHIG